MEKKTPFIRFVLIIRYPVPKADVYSKNKYQDYDFVLKMDFLSIKDSLMTLEYSSHKIVRR